MTTPRKYAFSWDVIGVSINDARPSLGKNLSIEIYRLLQFTMRDVMEQRYGTEAADTLFYDSGVLAGKHFFERYCAGITDLNILVKTIQERFKELGVGIFRVENADADNGKFTFVVDEDLDCSGLPDNDEHICVYDEGFIKGILEAFSGDSYDVKEVDCWSSGARTCRFDANKVG